MRAGNAVSHPQDIAGRFTDQNTTCPLNRCLQAWPALVHERLTRLTLHSSLACYRTKQDSKRTIVEHHTNNQHLSPYFLSTNAGTTVDMLGISFNDTAAITAAAAAAAADPNAEVAPPKKLLYTNLTKEKVCVHQCSSKER